MSAPDVDVLIVGGGLVGGSLALALQGSGLKVTLLEAQTDQERLTAATGDRALALSRGTVQSLKDLGLWDSVAEQAMAIHHIHVSDRGHFGKTRLWARDPGVEALGHVILARHLETALVAHLDRTALERICPARIIGLKAGLETIHVSLKEEDQSRTLSARLVVAADGGHSTVRKLLGIEQTLKDYGQSAIVTEVETERDTQPTAYDRFTRTGPLALLPIGPHRASVVWSLHPEEAQETLSLSESDIALRLQTTFGNWLGALQLVKRPVGFPLKLIQSGRMTDDRVVLIGNAMHQIHPVAGQGFNLGLRDAAVLAEWLITQRRLGLDLGDPEFLARYGEARRRDLSRVIRFTDSLVGIFSNDFPPMALARNLALFALERWPFAKRLLARNAMGYGA